MASIEYGNTKRLISSPRGSFYYPLGFTSTSAGIPTAQPRVRSFSPLLSLLFLFLSSSTPLLLLLRCCYFTASFERCKDPPPSSFSIRINGGKRLTASNGFLHETGPRLFRRDVVDEHATSSFAWWRGNGVCPDGNLFLEFSLHPLLLLVIVSVLSPTLIILPSFSSPFLFSKRGIPPPFSDSTRQRRFNTAFVVCFGSSFFVRGKRKKKKEKEETILNSTRVLSKPRR